MVPQYYGITVLWYYIITVLHDCGTTVLWYYKIMVLQYYGTTVLWYYNILGIQYYGKYCGTTVLWYCSIMVLRYCGTRHHTCPQLHHLYATDLGESTKKSYTVLVQNMELVFQYWVNSIISGRSPLLYCTLTLIAMQGHQIKNKNKT